MTEGPRVRVLVLINELLRGGAQRIVLDMANALDREGIELIVAVLKAPTVFKDAPNLIEEVRRAGVRVISLDGGAHFSLGEFRRLMALLRKERPHILHTFLPYAGIVGRLAGRLARVPRIISTQCNLPIAYSSRTYWLDRLTLPLADAWTGATEGIERSYGGSIAPFSRASWDQGRRHFTIVAGVDLPIFDARVAALDPVAKRRELSLPTDATLVLMVARLISWKGHHALIRAVAELPSSVHLALVGWGPLEAELKALAETLGVSERVHFLGARSDVPELLAAADLYAQTHGYAPDGSIWLGPNTAQMEACAARVPSVSTAVPLIEYLIEDGITGFLAKPDDPADIARAIARQIADPERARMMAERARARVEERYSVSAMVDAYEALYQQLG